MAYQPDDVAATGGNELPGLLQAVHLAVGKVIAYQFTPLHAKGNEGIAPANGTNLNGSAKQVCIEVGDVRARLADAGNNLLLQLRKKSCLVSGERGARRLRLRLSEAKKEQGARSKGQGARGKEQGAGGKEQEARGKYLSGSVDLSQLVRSYASVALMIGAAPQLYEAVDALDRLNIKSEAPLSFELSLTTKKPIKEITAILTKDKTD